MCVKPSGEYKNPSFRIVDDMITQGSFESVETTDILTKSLGNDEPSGHTCGQSKFVRQSHYFNIMQISKDNTKVSVVKCQLAALEKTVQELCAKHGIDRKTKADENTAPTVDNHNSFMANCTLNEKEPRVVYMECVLTDIVLGISLGEENMRVTITVPKLKHALLPISTNEATIMEEDVSGFVAWLKRLFVIDMSLSPAIRGPSHVPDRVVKGNKRIKKRAGKKKLQSEPEVQQQNTQQQLPSFNFSEVYFDLRPLAYYAQCFMRDDLQIECPIQLAISVIDPWDDSVMYFYLLENVLGDDFKDLIKLALND
ncbi:hypothetical protein TIFTF001_011937 [Ficus carica]|uniref:Uncharacterized protein n=1 Tax=Ficus carica TaxID=3494 RepID=A0AA88AF38_FICCA|nr:hypothetical protein TIFTF001_011937 [Ficus carica]